MYNQAAEKSMDSLISTNPRIKELLMQRGRDRASSMKWNTYILILVAVDLMAVVLLTIQGINTLIVGRIAVAGLLAVWFISGFQARRMEKKFFEQELENYNEMTPAETKTKEAGGPVAAGIPTAQPAQAPASDMPLTQRELEILVQMAAGKVNKEIATSLNISAMTVKNHISHILEKLSVNDRTSAVLLAIRNGWIKLDKV